MVAVIFGLIRYRVETSWKSEWQYSGLTVSAHKNMRELWAAGESCEILLSNIHIDVNDNVQYYFVSTGKPSWAARYGNENKIFETKCHGGVMQLGLRAAPCPILKRSIDWFCYAQLNCSTGLPIKVSDIDYKIITRLYPEEPYRKYTIVETALLIYSPIRAEADFCRHRIRCIAKTFGVTVGHKRRQ